MDYHYGEEEKIQQLIYTSKEPLLIKIKNFTDQFSLDYFEKHIHASTTYRIVENDRLMSLQEGDFSTIISQIKKNKPYRIFGHLLSIPESVEIEKHVPLWQKIPLRPRYFNRNFKVAYFFGGKGAHSYMHFDREHCCNLHLCLSGKKELLLFTENQSDCIYKLPFISNSLIDFSQPLNTLHKDFPRLNQAEGYNVFLEKGDMLFMPKNCWHYTKYLDAASSATYAFYPKKILHWYGYFTGYFFLGYSGLLGLQISEWPLVKKFSQSYAVSTGSKKYFFKLIEAVAFVFLLPIISLGSLILLKLKPRRVC